MKCVEQESRVQPNSSAHKVTNNSVNLYTTFEYFLSGMCVSAYLACGLCPVIKPYYFNLHLPKFKAITQD